MTRRPHAPRGFTLLEILIAVVVLAFGLLGVVAVFPAVIDLQRRAQDAVIGGASASSAEALFNASILSSDSLAWTEDFDDRDVPYEDRYPLRETLAGDLFLGTGGTVDANDAVAVDYRWETSWDWQRLNANQARRALLEEGTILLGGGLQTINNIDGLPAPGDLPFNGRFPEIGLRVADRLLPDAASDAPPRYVWDAVVRRVDTGIGNTVGGADFVTRDVLLKDVPKLPIEIAIFVRPIDRGIRVPVGRTLRDVLAGGEDLEPLSFPVAAAEDDLASRVLGGTIDNSVYSAPFSMQVKQGRPAVAEGEQAAGFASVSLLNPADLIPDRTIDGGFRPNLTNARDALRQVGQLFVDNLGIVHRVTAVRDDGLVEVEPPLNAPGILVNQIVYTPQVPVDIRVIRTR